MTPGRAWSPLKSPSSSSAARSSATSSQAGTNSLATERRLSGERALSAGLLLLLLHGLHAAGRDGFEQPPVILLVLPGVGGSEVRDGVVEDFACAQVASDHAGPPGPGVCPGECPATELAVVVELERVHEGDAHAAFHVT